MEKRVTQLGQSLVRSTTIPEQPKRKVKYPLLSPRSMGETSSLRTTPRTEPGEPWKKYCKCYRALDLVGQPHIAVEQSSKATRVLVQETPVLESTRLLRTFHQLQHPNVASIIEAFTTELSLYLILEEMISLNQIMACSSPMYNAQLIAILGQVRSL